MNISARAFLCEFTIIFSYDNFWFAATTIAEMPELIADLTYIANFEERAACENRMTLVHKYGTIKELILRESLVKSSTL